MPQIDSGPLQEIIKNIKATPAITSLLAKDPQNIVAVHPEQFQPINTIYPNMTISYSAGKSEASLPSSHDTLCIYTWVIEQSKEPYLFLDTIHGLLLGLFNRKGGQLNNLDVPTDSGVRFCEFLKMSQSTSFDDKCRCYYGELIFKVVRSEGESFAVVNAGDKPWT